MERIEFSWGSDSGTEIFAVDWRPGRDEKAVIVLVHGIGEHTGRYERFAAALGEAGYAVVGMDLPGHGRSSGKRGRSSFAQIADQIDLLIDEAHARHPGKPVFLYGHSLGGLLVLYYCLERKPDILGAVASSPALKTVEPVPAWKLLLARTVGALLPSIALSNGLKSDTLSRDPEIKRSYEADPLVHPLISARLGLDLLQTGPRVIAEAESITLPLLLMHGSADGIIDPQAARDFASNAGGNVTFKMFDGLSHELHNEPEREEVLKFATAWLDGRLRTSGGS